MASPVSAQSSQKSKSPLSPLLEHVRRTHVEAMENRTTRRIGELMGGQPAVFRREQSGEGIALTPLEEEQRSEQVRHDRAFVAQLLRSDEVRSDHARVSQLSLVHRMDNVGHQPPPSDEMRSEMHVRLDHARVLQPSLVHRMDNVRQQPSPPSYKEAVGPPKPHSGSFPMLQNSNGKYNITQRRSRGRSRDDADSILDPTIAARRPRSRSKDRRYSVESIGAVSRRDSDAELDQTNSEQTFAMRSQTPVEQTPVLVSDRGPFVQTPSTRIMARHMVNRDSSGLASAVMPNRGSLGQAPDVRPTGDVSGRYLSRAVTSPENVRGSLRPDPLLNINLEDQGVMKYERSHSKPSHQMSELGMGLGLISSPVPKLGRAESHPRPSVYDDRESNASGSDRGLEDDESLIYDGPFLKKYIPERERVIQNCTITFSKCGGIGKRF